MKSRWQRFYREQMKDPEMRELVERELESLEIGLQIARLRERKKLNQTKLAALSDMSAPKISAIENQARNVTVATLIRLARALDSKVEIKFVSRKKSGVGGRRRSSRAA